MRALQLPAFAAVTLLAACAAATGWGGPGARAGRAGDEIVVAGRFFHTGAPVVLWLDPGGYDAYRVECRFDPDQALATGSGAETTPNRYGTFRKHVPPEDLARVRESGWDLEILRRHVDQFVLHYDVCGTSRRCFEILQDKRGLSVHFMLDLDGTIYQTLDAKERAWHAGTANDRSVGVEIANIGAYPDLDVLGEWYGKDAAGRTRVILPESMGDGGIRTPGFVGRPARAEPIRGRLQGRDLIQYDFTEEQYESLARLAATLSRALPGIVLECPRDAGGAPRDRSFTAEELAAFRGVLGHYHVTEKKVDPGPALDWERFLDRARALAE